MNTASVGASRQAEKFSVKKVAESRSKKNKTKVEDEIKAVAQEVYAAMKSRSSQVAVDTESALRVHNFIGNRSEVDDKELIETMELLVSRYELDIS